MSESQNGIPYADIEIVKNSHADTTVTYWTVEIDTKLSKKKALKLAEMIHNLEF